MTQFHGNPTFDKSQHLWQACSPCKLLTTDRESHNKKVHMDVQTSASQTSVSVRLLLPNGAVAVGRFQLSDTVATVLATHSTIIRQVVGNLGPEEEVAIHCEDTILLPG